MTTNGSGNSASDSERYARHRLITWWDQDLLRQSRVMVVGAGAVGNEVLKNLALLGVGNLIAVDLDAVEESNLSRTVLFTRDDIGKPKAAAAAAAVQRLNPNVRCESIDGDLELDVGLGTAWNCDLILGCVDSVNARWAINRMALRAGVPWINAGINQDSIEIASFDPDEGACYECGMTDQMWKRFNERRSCMLLMKTMPPQVVPTTAVVASLAGSLQVNEAVCALHRRDNRLLPGQKAFFSTNPYSFFVVDLLRDAECPAHEKYTRDALYAGDPATTTGDDLLASVSDATCLELDFDLLVGLECKRCDTTDECGTPAKRIRTSALPCPRCGEPRAPSITTQIAKNSILSKRRLRDLGIPSGAVLRVHTLAGNRFVQLQ